MGGFRSAATLHRFCALDCWQLMTLVPDNGPASSLGLGGLGDCDPEPNHARDWSAHWSPSPSPFALASSLQCPLSTSTIPSGRKFPVRRRERFLDRRSGNSPPAGIILLTLWCGAPEPTAAGGCGREESVLRRSRVPPLQQISRHRHAWLEHCTDGIAQRGSTAAR